MKSEEERFGLEVRMRDLMAIMLSQRGKGDEEESLLNYGFSKARRSDLKQIVVGVAMTKDGIPLSHKTYSGNTNDLSCFEAMLKKFRKDHNQSKITFVVKSRIQRY